MDGGVSECVLALLGDVLARGDSVRCDVAFDISAVSANANAAAFCASSCAVAFAVVGMGPGPKPGPPSAALNFVIAPCARCNSAACAASSAAACSCSIVVSASSAAISAASAARKSCMVFLRVDAPGDGVVLDGVGETGGSSGESELAMVGAGCLQARARERGEPCWRSARFDVVEVWSVRSIGGCQSAVLV